ncbi:MAG: hypothetical protein V4727_10985 [Verrucomicrobiota bacterium]
MSHRSWVMTGGLITLATWRLLPTIVLRSFLLGSGHCWQTTLETTASSSVFMETILMGIRISDPWLFRQIVSLSSRSFGTSYVQTSATNKPHRAITTSRSLSMIYPDYNLNPVTDARSRW